MTNDTDRKLPRKRAEHRLVSVGDRRITNDGRYHHNCAVEWAVWKANTRWAKIGEFTRAMSGGDGGIQAKRKIRGKLNELRKRMREENHMVLLIEYGGDHGAATAIKIYDPTNISDQREADALIERAVTVGELKTGEAAALKKLVTELNSAPVIEHQPPSTQPNQPPPSAI
jgi:hypothetical protein